MNGLDILLIGILVSMGAPFIAVAWMLWRDK